MTVHTATERERTKDGKREKGSGVFYFMLAVWSVAARVYAKNDHSGPVSPSNEYKFGANEDRDDVRERNMNASQPRLE